MKRKPYVFSDWLKATRKSLGLTRQNVAKRSGGAISQQYIHRMESGQNTNIGSDKLLALAKGLNVPLAVLQSALFEGVCPEIPVLGRVSGGPEVNDLAEEYQHETLEYTSQTGSQKIFAMEMMGDSMAPKIEHGDMVIAERHMGPVVSGGVYVLAKGKRRTCKYLVEDAAERGKFWIRAENEALFARVSLDKHYKIEGKVIEVRKTQTLFCPVLN